MTQVAIAPEGAEGEGTEGEDTGASTAGFGGAGFRSRVRGGVGALSLNAIARVGGQMALVPVAMAGWGAERYGEWVVLAGLVGFLRLTDLGLQTYVVNRLCGSYSNDRTGELHRVLHSALRIHVPLVVTLLCLTALVLLVVPVRDLLSLGTTGQIEARLALGLLSFELLLGIPMGVIAGVYRATGRLTRGAFVGTVQAAAQVLVVLALVAGGRGFVLVGSGRVIVAVSISLWILYDLKRLYPWLRFRGSGDWKEGAAMIGPGLLFMLFPIADLLSTQVSLIALQKFTDGETVSRLATHRTAVNAAQLASGLVINAIWPELTALHARREFDRLRQVQRSLTRHHVWLVSAVIFGMLPFLPWIYSSWTLGRLAVDPLTLGLLIARVVLWGYWSASMTLLQATNRHGPAAFAVVGSSIAGAVLVLFLVPRYGMQGAAAALLLGDLCLAAWLIPRIAARATGDRLSTGLLQLGRDLSVSLAAPVLLGLAVWWRVGSQPGREFVMAALVVPLALFAACQQFSVSPRTLVKHVRRRFSGWNSSR